MTTLASTIHQATGLLEGTRNNKHIFHTRIHVQDARGHFHNSTSIPVSLIPYSSLCGHVLLHAYATTCI
jgi:hypothetical protein